jgi:hypothetical protein
MSNISISNLHSAGSDLFSGDENFMTEMSENDFASITGGMDTPATDWCTTTRPTVIYTRTDPILTVTFTPPIKTIAY